jgi:hypothetical protein
MTPTETRMKANKVPMLVNSIASLMSTNIAGMPTKTPVRMVVTYGVRNRGCTLAAHGGRSPSRAITMKIRGWPSWKTSSTAVIATTAPKERMPARAWSPADWSAFARGSPTPRSFQLTIPVRTRVTAA